MKGTVEHLPQLFLRLTISVTMLSAVADRFGFWGENSAWGNWENFENYTQQLTFFLPESVGSFSAYAATFLEVLFPLMLIFGFKTKWAAWGTGLLLLVFALSMSISLGIKAPLDYSVWISVAAAFLLAIQSDYKYSIDTLIKKS
ncbi:DoxX family protein [Chryseobacterium sp. Leaf404]|uniref:DoxX family protein n=1 Tax=unclassified Chryseobacterium TaxID=2593645 RepID=UPI0006F549D0|nr:MULTISPECIES: DoxX family protein [unclassified Chryseobacterium]KQT17118.1 DoxX family protein [Chryseobacterium sp. Leaf404]